VIAIASVNSGRNRRRKDNPQYNEPMRTVAKYLGALGLAYAAAVAADLNEPAPKIDVQKLEAYVRYTEGFTPQVKMVIDKPAASVYKGYFRVMVHLSIDRDKGTQNVGDKLYYTSNGQRFFNGQLWDLDQNPFVDTLERLPTDGPSLGPANAPVTVVVFSDFQCPYCREFAKTIRNNVPGKYPKEVRVIFKDFPLESVHPWAFAAGEAAHCVSEQNPAAFWPFHDWIFEHQGEVTAQNLKEKTLAFAQQQKLVAGPISACLDSHRAAAAVKESLQAGQELQVQQTPTLFVNGRMLGGAVPWSTLDAVIQLELKRPKEVPGPSSEKCCQVSAPTVLSK